MISLVVETYVLILTTCLEYLPNNKEVEKTTRHVQVQVCCDSVKIIIREGEWGSGSIGTVVVMCTQTFVTVSSVL